MRQQQSENKLYIEVAATFLPDGRVVPTAIRWVDGRVFEVDRVLDARPAASTKAGGAGMRYTCRILGRERYLWREEERWFVERQ